MDPRLWAATEALFAVGAALMAAGHAKARGGLRARRLDWVKFAVYFVLIHVLLVFASSGRALTLALLSCFWVAGTREAVSCRRRLPRGLAVLPPALLAVGFAHALLAPGPDWRASFAFLMLLVAATDSYAQLCGKLWGTRRPFPTLSPNKTAEGILGGIGAALVVGWACGFLAPGYSVPERVLIGIATSAACVAGDLIFSAVKRRARIKDFSAVLPGHGGILDRFDSMALAAPVYVWSRTLLHGLPS